MGNPGGGGAGLGNARGTVTIEAQVQNAANQLAAFSVTVEQTFDRVNRSTQATEKGFNALSGSLKLLAGAFGVAYGPQIVGQIARFGVEAANVATAYERQLVAAENLAGSQSELNELLGVYEQATGNILDQSTALQNVTKLMAVGFADTGAELERFATAIRGISIAMGVSQEMVQNNLLLELFTQRGARLDQLGLQYDKVRERAAEMREEDESLTRQAAYQQAVLEQANERYGDIVDSAAGAASGIEKITKAWQDMRLEIGQELKPSFDFLGEELTWVLGLLQKFREDSTRQLHFDQAKRAQWEREQGLSGGTNPQWVLDFQEWFKEFSKLRPPALNLDPSAQPWMTPSLPPFTPQGQGPWTPEQTDVAVERGRAMAELERETSQAILDENTRYQDRRLQMVRDYEENLTRSAADYAKQRQRSIEAYDKEVSRFQRDAARRDLRFAENHARSIERMQRDSAQRLADLEEDLNESIAQRRLDSADKIAEWTEDRDEAINESRADSAERLQEIEEDYNKQRLRALQDHQSAMADAAARLDARAIFQEQARFNREQELAKEAQQEKVDNEEEKLDEAIANLNEAYEEKLEDEQKALNKSIEQANKAYDRQVADENAALQQRIDDANTAYGQQLADAKENDELRLADMATDFEEEMKQRDQDQIDRINAMKEDHLQDLGELETEHGNRLTQIGTHAEEERDQLQREFNDKLADQGRYNQNWRTAQDAFEAQALKDTEIYLSQQRILYLKSQEAQLKSDIVLSNSLTEAAAIGLELSKVTGELNKENENLLQLESDRAALPEPVYLVPLLTGRGGGSNQTSTSEQVRDAGLVVEDAGMTTTTPGATVAIASGAITVNVSGISGQTANELATIIDQHIYNAVVRASSAY